MDLTTSSIGRRGKGQLSKWSCKEKAVFEQDGGKQAVHCSELGAHALGWRTM